ncbi:MAG: DUF2461 domain-containing protein [Candidatus Hatepunaea meridiana]|nr:DUF2461 domain-containing protein [Candidatus Hatepunaea meridiana]
MRQISVESFKFMADLWNNNNKQWFTDNRRRYEETVRLPLKSLAEALAEPVASILPEFTGKPKMSRINNDIRFSLNKPPYKEHIWISFGKVKGSCADIFVAIGRNGWAAGCGIGAPKQEQLDGWRKNLLEHRDVWRRYAQAAGMGEKIGIYINNSYKKPLFPDIPDDLMQLVQAKSVWLVEIPKTEFNDNPERDFFISI